MMRHPWLALALTGLLSLPAGLPADGQQPLDSDRADTLARLARGFRMRVYETFRLDRAELDRRHAAWARVEADWNAAGRPVDQFDKITGWLRSATRASSPGSLARLPELPRFRRPAQRSPLVERPAAKPVEQPAAPLLAPSAARLAVVERTLTPHSPGRPDVVADNHTPCAEPRAVSPRAAISRAEPELAERPLDATRTPMAFGAIDASAEPEPVAEMLATPQAAALSGPPNMAARHRDVRELPASGVPLRAELPARNPPAVAAVAGIRVAASPELAKRPVPPVVKSSARPPSIDVLAEEEPVIRVSHHRATVGDSVPPPRNKQHNPNSLSTLAFRQAVTRRGEKSGVPVRPPVVVAKPRVIDAGPQVVDTKPRVVVAKPQAAASHAKLNLSELAARTAGHNLAIVALESELDKERIWTAREIEPLVARLRRLVTRSADLDLYHELVPAADRWLIGRVESAKRLISHLAARIVEARTRASSDQFPGSHAEQTAELQRLDRLSRELAELATWQ